MIITNEIAKNKYDEYSNKDTKLYRGCKLCGRY